MSDCVGSAIAPLRKLFEESNVDRCHGIDHALTVRAHAQRACNFVMLGPAQVAAIELAALLHDADDRKFFSISVDLDNAKAICRQVAPHLEVDVIRMISRVSFSKNGNTIDPALPAWLLIPRWCDRIEATGKIGIWRCYVFSMESGRPLMSPEDRLPRSREELEELASPERYEIYLKTKGTCSTSFIGHFYDKILHLSVQTGNPYIDGRLTEGREEIVQFLLAFDPAEPMATLGPIIEEFGGH
jgi:uncharacterized protein